MSEIELCEGIARCANALPKMGEGHKDLCLKIEKVLKAINEEVLDGKYEIFYNIDEKLPVTDEEY